MRLTGRRILLALLAAPRAPHVYLSPPLECIFGHIHIISRFRGAVGYGEIQRDTARYGRIQLETVGYSGIRLQWICCKMGRYRIDIQGTGKGYTWIPRIR